MKIIIDPETKTHMNGMKLLQPLTIAKLECEHCGHRQLDKFASTEQNYKSNTVPRYRFCRGCGRNSHRQTPAQASR